MELPEVKGVVVGFGYVEVPLVAIGEVGVVAARCDAYVLEDVGCVDAVLDAEGVCVGGGNDDVDPADVVGIVIGAVGLGDENVDEPTGFVGLKEVGVNVVLQSGRERFEVVVIVVVVR